MKSPRTRYPWQEPVLEVLTEHRGEHLAPKINAAERAICRRLRERPSEREELLALKDALHAIQILYLQSLRAEKKSDRDAAGRNTMVS